MHKPTISFLFFLLVSKFVFSQNGNTVYRKELTITTENDNYNFTKADRYYSNGFFVKYQWLANQNKKAAIKLRRVEAGQMIFNPHLNRRSLSQVLEQQDRPYAGWLYGSYGETSVYSNDRVVQWDAIAGVVGPASKGEEVQTKYHQFIGLYKIYGWENQVQNEFGVNASVRYYHPLSISNGFTMHATGKAMLGNTFTNASVGVLLKTGKMEKESSTSFFTGRLGSAPKDRRHHAEFVFFLEPMLQAQAYNATVQGPMFRENKGNYVSELNPFIYVVKTGFVVAGPAVSFSAYYHIKQREAKSMIDPLEVYGAFALSFRFR
ncbi:lipid A deacylase LpxR family protein [Lacibacter luteus]|uniref:Lipid A deacylase LpxR family protein n=1 Tax=Lacibacter luteus TaxID=2508719 RepID=A0A4Q1CJM2_9BACT|nr:lipid A deacylase LpxR family protein [Lacibacter luteus]RXK60554.1 lipid A deacylase LpxR family protein [Lacibacter luteus]